MGLDQLLNHRIDHRRKHVLEENIRNIQFYGFNETVLNPLALAFTVVMAALVIFVKREYVVLPFIATACFITHRQRIVLGGLDFDMIRLLIVVGLARIAVRGERSGVVMNRIDKLILAFAVSATLMHSVQMRSFSAFLYKLGFSFDTLGAYYIFRCVIRSSDEVRITIKALALCAVPMASAMLMEQVSNRNYFSIFGGVSEFTMERDGKLRSQGAFSHPILAGTFGAVIVPLFIGYWHKFKESRGLVSAGILCGSIMVVTSSSSGPVLGYIACLLWLSLWSVRKYLRWIIGFVVAILISLHLVMKDPVWALIWRFKVVSASTGYHRYALLNAAITRIDEWWFAGTRNMKYWGWGLQDVTNQYVRVGVDGGILPLMLFIILIVSCFGVLIRASTSLRRRVGDQRLSWCIAASLFGHAVSFIGVSYFGQIILFWNMTLAIIGTIAAAIGLEDAAPEHCAAG